MSRLLPLVLAALCAANMSAAQSQSTTEIAWVGLFNHALFDWLENVNRLESLCSPSKPGSIAFEECRAEKLATKVHVVRLFSGPRITAGSAGSVLLVATPALDVGLRAFFVSNEGGAATSFVPDLFDPDWGYGPYFHETFLERRGTWFLLPEGPFKKGTWFNAADLGPDLEVKRLDAGDIITGPQGDLYVLAIEPGFLRARPEQDTDMWCDSNPAPPLRPFMESRIPLRQLYSATGHLLLHVKYTRGC
jgi:hypothetical protein